MSESEQGSYAAERSFHQLTANMDMVLESDVNEEQIHLNAAQISHHSMEDDIPLHARAEIGGANLERISSDRQLHRRMSRSGTFGRNGSASSFHAGGERNSSHQDGSARVIRVIGAHDPREPDPNGPSTDIIDPSQLPAVRRPYYSCCQQFLRSFTIPRITWFVLSAISIGLVSHFCPEGRANPWAWKAVPDKPGSDKFVKKLVMPKEHPIRQAMVICTLVLMLILMIEDVNVGLVMFVTALQLWGYSLIDKTVLFAGAVDSTVILYSALFVLAAIFAETQILEKALGKMVGSPKNLWAMLRLIIPLMMLSMFLNNGPCTAMGIPLAVSVADQFGLYHANALIMAIPFAASLGGNLSAIGSSPNTVAQEYINTSAGQGGKFRCYAAEISRIGDSIFGKNWRNDANDAALGGSFGTDGKADPIGYLSSRTSLLWQQKCTRPTETDPRNMLSAQFDGKGEPLVSHAAAILLSGGRDKEFKNELLGPAWSCVNEFLSKNSAESAKLLKEIEGRCKFGLLQPVFVLSGVFGCVAGIFGIMYAMFTLNKIYRRPNAKVEEDDQTGIEMNEQVVSSFEEENRTRRNSKIEAGLPLMDNRDDENYSSKMYAENRQNDNSKKSINGYEDSPGDGPEEETSAIIVPKEKVFEIQVTINKGLSQVIGCELCTSPIGTYKGVTVTHHNGIPLLRDGQRDPEVCATILKAQDTMTITCGAEAIVKLRKNFPLLSFNTPYYALLGRSRKLRLIFQIAVTQAFMDELDDSDFLETYDACIVGKDYENNILLVEGFPELAKVKDDDFILISTVAGSSPPRCTTTADNLRGALCLGLFLVVVILNALGSQSPKHDTDPAKIESGQWAMGLLTFKDEFYVYMHLIGIIGLMIRAITFKQALSSQGGATLLLFAFAKPVSDAMVQTGVAAMLGNMITKASAGYPFLAITLVYVVVAILTQFIDNRTLVVMLKDSVCEACIMVGMPAIPLMTCLVSASCAVFMSPIGCSHNQFATVAAGYGFKDYIQAGWVTQLSNFVVTVMFLWVWVTYIDKPIDIHGTVPALVFGHQ